MIKYYKDDRYENDLPEDDGPHVVTHDLMEFRAIAAATLESVQAECEDYGVVGVDEGQFVCCCFHPMAIDIHHHQVSRCRCGM